MFFLEIIFVLLLIVCGAYASIWGGRTGRAGAAIFLCATILSSVAATANPDWTSTSYGVFSVDAGCMLALCLLALASDRYWPIWAFGFQIVAVATHIATMWAPDIVPKAYQAILAFWSIPILAVMVIGTKLDQMASKTA
jgi:hypothetical protein